MTELDATRDTLYGHLFDALVEAGTSDEVTDLVLAAFDSSEKLRSVLAGEPATRAEPRRLPAPDVADIPGIYLRSITVRGFRGVGQQATLDLQPGPGLTLVLGRNGSGKSSFAEAAELTLTDRTERAERGKVWKDGWRNLHRDSAPRIAVTVTVEGAGKPRTIVRAWPEDSRELAGATTTVHVQGDPAARPYAALGWRDALIDYRPFLAYTELSGLITSPGSQIFDMLAPILGLDDMTAADQRLQQAHSELDGRLKGVRARRAALLDTLEPLTDPRALVVRAALKSSTARNWDLAALAGAVGAPGDAPRPGDGDPGANGQHKVDDLRRLAELAIPEIDEVTQRSSDLRAAADRAAALAGSHAVRSRRLAQLLRAGLAHRQQSDDETCPLCGSPDRLTDDWRSRTLDHLAQAEQQAAQADQVHDEIQRATIRVLAVVSDLPALLAERRSDEFAALAGDARAAWQAWVGLRQIEGPARLADELERRYETLACAVEALRAAAGSRVRAIETAWAPVAAGVADWLGDAREALAGQPRLAALTDAREFLRSTIQRLRDERIEPFADELRAIWSELRQESNVDLGRIQLVGTANHRTLRLEASVDGVDGEALGVMSQGELHALGLSIFLPRATRPESPFRFVVIDDPVQAMDPAKVDGLARVLLRVGRNRQVVVFTHDDRLADAVRRIATPEDKARRIEVVRREKSIVEPREAAAPAMQLLEDAEALALTGNLPEDVRAGVVPGMCKSAVDAICADVVRRRWLAAGAHHDEVESQLTAARTTRAKAALAFFDDTSRAGDVLTRANQWGVEYRDTLRAVSKGGHEPYPGDCRALVRATFRLVGKIGDLG
jgi:ABC-type uncharacterized transport system ATPase subunit